MNQEMSQEVGCLNLLVFHFFIEKMCFSVFVLFKVNLRGLSHVGFRTGVKLPLYMRKLLSVVTRSTRGKISPRGDFEHRHGSNFGPGWNFQFQPGLKKLVSHLSLNPGQSKYFFTSFYPEMTIYLQRFGAYFAKTFYGKKTFCMQLQDYI